MSALERVVKGLRNSEGDFPDSWEDWLGRAAHFADDPRIKEAIHRQRGLRRDVKQ